MNNLPSFIETKQLILKPLTSGHVSERYVAWLNDPDVNQYLETRFITQTIESCLNFVNTCQTNANTYLFGIFTKKTFNHIGNCKIDFFEERHKKAQIGLLIGEKSFRAKGLGKEVIQALTKFAFTHLDIERLEAGCYEDNLASLHLFKSCGYQIDGLLRKSVICDGKRMGLYALGILKSDLKP